MGPCPRPGGRRHPKTLLVLALCRYAIGSAVTEIAVRIGLTLLAVIVTIGLAEIAFRLADVRGSFEDRTHYLLQAAELPPSERMPGVSVQFRPGSSFQLNYDRPRRSYFNEHNGLEYQINRHGFRGPDWSFAKAPGTIRIVLLGDSFTFGEGVKWPDTFAQRLERILSQGSSRNIEVLNLGISGWGTTDEINYLAARGADLAADLVLVIYVLNDADSAGGLDLWKEFRETYEATGVLRHSYFLSFAYARIARHLYARRYVDGMVERAARDEASWQTSLAGLTFGRDLVRAWGGRFGVVIFPFMYQLEEDYPFRSLHSKVSRHCETNAIPVLDLLPAFTGRRYEALWVHPTDQHPNEIGHRIAAEAIAAFILNSHLLKPQGEVESANLLQ